MEEGNRRLDERLREIEQLVARVNELEAALSSEQRHRVVDRSHHVDDFEVLRARIVLMLDVTRICSPMALTHYDTTVPTSRRNTWSALLMRSQRSGTGSSWSEQAGNDRRFRLRNDKQPHFGCFPRPSHRRHRRGRAYRPSRQSYAMRVRRSSSAAKRRRHSTRRPGSTGTPCAPRRSFLARSRYTSAESSAARSTSSVTGRTSREDSGASGRASRCPRWRHPGGRHDSGHNERSTARGTS